MGKFRKKKNTLKIEADFWRFSIRFWFRVKVDFFQNVNDDHVPLTEILANFVILFIAKMTNIYTNLIKVCANLAWD